MKKILVFGLSSYFGGIESFFYNYLRYNNKNLIQFDIVPDDGQLAREHDFLELGCNIINLCNYRVAPLRYKSELNSVFQENVYDVVYVNALSAYNLLPLKLAKKHDIKKRIIHSHNSSAPHNICKYIIHEFNKSKINSLATHKIACSDSAALWMFTDKNYVIIKNAIDANKFYYSEDVRTKYRIRLGIKDDEFVLGFVGRLAEQKNPLFLIDIMNELSKFSDYKFKLIMVGDGKLRSAIEKKIIEYNLNTSVFLLGNRTDVAELYQAFDLFLLPSIFEGLGMVLIEAQFSGLNCIVSDRVPDEVNISGCVSYLPIASASDWANKIIEHTKIKISRTDLISYCNTDYDIDYSYKNFYELVK